MHQLHPTASLSELRRHPKKGEKPLSKVKKVPESKKSYNQLTPADKDVRSRARKVYYGVLSGKISLDAASRKYGLTPRRARRSIDGFRKKNGRWQTKKVVRNEVSMLIYSRGRGIYILVPDTQQASLIGRYHNAVKTYLRTHDSKVLRPFVGRKIVASDGTAYELETDPETLYSLWERRPEEEEREIYGLGD
ncbi:hypothetical protein [Methanomassiliicoccus luminyensis]|uniref:hypothetical protein n=1 Tax=Methanomassiliicoccus luminyensis TaxID=1080712 RepID=UPI00036B7DAE|nr:hypothetical protein [Methanomassiliicoccus luminyensis]